MRVELENADASLDECRVMWRIGFNRGYFIPESCPPRFRGPNLCVGQLILTEPGWNVVNAFAIDGRVLQMRHVEPICWGSNPVSIDTFSIGLNQIAFH